MQPQPFLSTLQGPYPTAAPPAPEPDQSGRQGPTLQVLVVHQLSGQPTAWEAEGFRVSIGIWNTFPRGDGGGDTSRILLQRQIYFKCVYIFVS